MVPADSCRISRVPHYSGAVSLIRRIFGYRPFTFCGGAFQHLLLIFACRFIDGPSTPADALPHRRFGLLRVRSPLLAQSLLFSLPPGTEMFQFPGFAPRMARCREVVPAGCPIRKSAYHRIFAPTRGLSQLVTSFVASESQGILHVPLSPFLVSFACKPLSGLSCRAELTSSEVARVTR